MTILAPTPTADQERTVLCTVAGCREQFHATLPGIAPTHRGHRRALPGLFTIEAVLTHDSTGWQTELIMHETPARLNAFESHSLSRALAAVAKWCRTRNEEAAR